MTTDSCILTFPHPDEIDDPLTLVLREGARRLLAQAVEAEAEAFLAAMADERLADGRSRVVRHGHGPERMLQTGIGTVPVKRAKLRDRGAEVSGDDRITFTSAILPKWVSIPDQNGSNSRSDRPQLSGKAFALARLPTP